MLRVYQYNGLRFRFEDGDVPEGAVLCEKKIEEPKNKAKKPENKKRKAATK